LGTGKCIHELVRRDISEEERELYVGQGEKTTLILGALTERYKRTGERSKGN